MQHSNSLRSFVKQVIFYYFETIIHLQKFKDFLLTLNVIMLEWFIKIKNMVFAFFNLIHLLVFLWLCGIN
jgi:hypothetical protein